MPTDDLKTLKDWRRLQGIRRCNTYPTVRDEDVAQHSFYVALLGYFVAREYNQNAGQQNLQVHMWDDENRVPIFDPEYVLKTALFHDLEEVYTSDIPAPIKGLSMDLEAEIKNFLLLIHKDAGEVVHWIDQYTNASRDDMNGQLLHIIDRLELAWYCYEEVQRGNQDIKEMLEICINIITVEYHDFTELVKQYSPTFAALLNLIGGE